jgi:hypothetical protein
MGRNCPIPIRQGSKDRSTVTCASCVYRAAESLSLDSRRTAILLVGGDKTGDDRFYKEMIPVADRLYDDYIAE